MCCVALISFHFVMKWNNGVGARTINTEIMVCGGYPPNPQKMNKWCVVGGTPDHLNNFYLKEII